MQPLLPVDYINPTLANMGDWQDRHFAAIHSPRGTERAIVRMLDGWIDYAHVHAGRYGSSISDDSVLGPAWAQIGAAIRTLLNGECGRLDCETLDHIIAENLSRCGFDADKL